jgi:hypothetical protein
MTAGRPLSNIARSGAQPSAVDTELHSGQYSIVTTKPKDVIEELFRRGTAGDESAAIDELVAEDMVNHTAGPARQGREGWKQIIENIRTDLGNDFSIENHHLIGEGDLVAHHMTIRGHHQRRRCRSWLASAPRVTM